MVSASPVADEIAPDAARTVSLRRHERAVGVLWVAAGSLLALAAGGSLAATVLGRSIPAATLWSLSLVTSYGLCLIVVGLAAWHGTTRAVHVGLALSAVPLVVGFVGRHLVLGAVPLALIILAGRTIRLARPPRSRSRPIRLVGRALGWLAVVVVAMHAGALTGGAVGMVVGGLIGGVATALHLIAGGSGLALVGALAMGGVGGAAGGAWGGLIGAAMANPLGSRSRAAVHLGGIAVGLGSVLAWVAANATTPDWSRSFRGAELGVTLVLALSAGGLGAIAGAAPAGWIARAFAGQSGTAANAVPR